MGLTVREHVVLGYRVRNERNRLWSDLFTAGALHRDSTDEKERGRLSRRPARAHECRQDARGVAPARNRATRSRSHARSPTGPSVVLLDEPSSGLDAHETSQLGSALRRVVDEERVSMLLVEHDVAMVLGLSSSVTVLDFGLCIAQGTPDTIRNDPGGPRRVPR